MKPTLTILEISCLNYRQLLICNIFVFQGFFAIIRFQIFLNRKIWEHDTNNNCVNSFWHGRWFWHDGANRKDWYDYMLLSTPTENQWKIGYKLIDAFVCCYKRLFWPWNIIIYYHVRLRWCLLYFNSYLYVINWYWVCLSILKYLQYHITKYYLIQ